MSNPNGKQFCQFVNSNYCRLLSLPEAKFLTCIWFVFQSDLLGITAVHLLWLSTSLSISLSIYIFNNSRLEGNIKKAVQKRDMDSVPEQKYCQSGNIYPGKYMIFIEARVYARCTARSSGEREKERERERESILNPVTSTFV